VCLLHNWLEVECSRKKSEYQIHEEMQGRKTFEDERELRFSLSTHVPGHNFYRRLKDRLDLDFLYELTQPYYGRCGQHSIDPIVFFKLCLVARLENIDSDRRLIEHCSLRLDLLYFLDYQLDEPLPWHSTLSRTRQPLPVELFEEVFTHVLSLCAEAGMISGHTQVVDSALIKANASMGALELKVPAEQLEARLRQVRTFSSADRRGRQDKAPLGQRTLTARQEELRGLQALHGKWRAAQNLRPGGSNKGAKYTSNKTHYSPVDPDARIAVKPGKARRLCYHLQLSVDASRHVITHVLADHADRKDSRCLPDLLEGLTRRLQGQGLRCTSLLADSGYSSGHNYALLEQEGIAAFIPPNGKYRGAPEGFTYEKEGGLLPVPRGQEGCFLPANQQGQGRAGPIQAVPDLAPGLQGLPLENELLRQTARKENRRHLLPRRVRAHDHPDPGPLGAAREAPAAGHRGAGAGHPAKSYGYAKGQHSRAGACP